MKVTNNTTYTLELTSRELYLLLQAVSCASEALMNHDNGWLRSITATEAIKFKDVINKVLDKEFR